MNIYAISYQNIGPFIGKIKSLIFPEGKYLIKSPVGKGKSFLFFDGPLYGLYKFTTRNILNINSKNGFVKILFSHHNNYYLIERYISLTKTGSESVSSKFYQLNIDNQLKLYQFLYEKLPDMIHDNVDFTKILINKFQQNEISFKSELELKNNLEDLLVPREVFLQTNFLLQDADNIFELSPADRINIFKHIFQLLDLDVAKEKIAEKKRELQLQIKIKSDNSKFEQKLKIILTQLDLHYQELNKILQQIPTNKLGDKLMHIFNSWYQDSQLQNFHKFIGDLNLISTNLNIGNLNIAIQEKINFQIYYDLLNKIKSEHQQQQFQYQTIEHQIAEINKNITNLAKEIIKFSQILSDKKEIINKFITVDTNILKIQKQKLGEEKNQILQNINISAFVQAGYHNIEDINTAYNICETLKAEGINIKDKIINLEGQILLLQKQTEDLQNKLAQFELIPGRESYELYKQEINNLSSEYQNQLDKIELQIRNVEYQNQNIQDQIQYQHKQLENLQTIQQNKKFICPKFDEACPYQEEIQGTNQLSDQICKLKTEIQTLEQKFAHNNLKEEISALITKKNNILTLQNQLANQPDKLLINFFAKLNIQKDKIKQQLDSLNCSNQIAELNNNKSKLELRITEIKNFLVAVNWQNIKQQVTITQELNKQILNFEKQIQEYELITQQQKQLTEEIIKLEANISNYQEQKINFEKNLQGQILQQQQLIDDLKTYHIDLVEKIFSKIELTTEYWHAYQNLALEYKSEQLLLKQMQENEQIASNLYAILSKEFLLVVLQTYLPSLAEIINSFLAQIMNFELRFHLLKKTSDKLELEIKIQDKQGIRSVKSLSGGQKTILKLVRILAIAVFTKSEMIFLDETINNLDVDSIGKVSELLENYLKTYQKKLYIITHSTQIQNMNCWDKIIEIN